MSSPISLSAKRAERDGTSATFRPFIEATRDSEDYVLGWEVGLLFGRLDNKPEKWGGTYHAANAEDIRRTAAACGYDVVIELSGDPNWIFVDFTRRVLEVVR